MWLGVILKTRDWIVCSKYANHSQWNSQQDLGGGVLYDHLISMRISNLIGKKMIFIYSFGKMSSQMCKLDFMILQTNLQ